MKYIYYSILKHIRKQFISLQVSEASQRRLVARFTQLKSSNYFGNAYNMNYASCRLLFMQIGQDCSEIQYIFPVC